MGYPPPRMSPAGFAGSSFIPLREIAHSQPISGFNSRFAVIRLLGKAET
jgi:hypothetical protein